MTKNAPSGKGGAPIGLGSESSPWWGGRTINPDQRSAQPLPERTVADGDARLFDRARWLREVDAFVTGFAARAATWDYFLGDFDDDRLHHDAGRPQLELFPLRVGWR
jgi:hypothetical protein